jgi:plasmid replication initiation protein
MEKGNKIVVMKIDGERILKKKRGGIEIKSKSGLSRMAQLLFAVVLTNIKEKDDGNTIYKADAYELGKIIGTPLKNTPRDIRRAINELLGFLVEIKTEKGWIKTALISEGEYITGDGEIKIRLAPSWLKYLKAGKENFAKYKLEYLFHLKSKNLINFYQILKDEATIFWRYHPDQKIAQLELDYSQFKEELGVKNYEWAHIKKRIICPAMDAFLTTDIRLLLTKIEKRGRGGKIKKIIFWVGKPFGNNSNERGEILEKIQVYGWGLGIYIRELRWINPNEIKLEIIQNNQIKNRIWTKEEALKKIEEWKGIKCGLI